MSYPTALKAFTVIRKAIVAQSEEAALLLFVILERGGVVKVEVVPKVSAETLMNLTLIMVRRGSLIYTERFRSYDALMCCGYRHLRVDHRKRFSSGKAYINSLEGFWAYAKERLINIMGSLKNISPLPKREAIPLSLST